MSTIQKSVTGNHYMDYDTWAEKIKGSYGHFGRPEDVKYGAWTRGATRSDDEAEFSWLATPDRDESGTPSPELWKENISNNPRAATINKYRKEMLDLARDVPENCYELSLRDIVEVPRITKQLNENVDSKLEKKKKKKKKGMRRMLRSGSVDNGGPLLKMFVPRMSAPVKRREGEWWSEMVSSTSSSSSSGSSNSSRSSRILSSCYPFLGHKGKSMGTEE